MGDWVNLTIKTNSKVKNGCNRFDVRVSGLENGGYETEEAGNNGVSDASSVLGRSGYRWV